MFHNSYYAACVIALSLIVLFCGKDTTKDKLLFIIMLAAGLFPHVLNFMVFLAIYYSHINSAQVKRFQNQYQNNSIWYCYDRIIGLGWME